MTVEEKKYVPLDDVEAIMNAYKAYYDNYMQNVNYELIIAELSKPRVEKGI